MAEDEEAAASDPFVERSVFPDAAAVFSYRPPPLASVLGSCVVVLDTNVLLVPYTISPKTLDEIGRTYRQLLDGGRLVVPAQVAREFGKNRARKLSELYQALTNKRSAIKTLQAGRYPLLQSVAEYESVTNLESQVDGLLHQYKDGLAVLLERVKGWSWDDPVSLLYSELFKPDVVVEASITEVDLRKDMDRRIRAKLPPGYKDSTKAVNAAGDLLIWHTILDIGRKRKKPVLLVSGDVKPDWWHKSSGQPLYPRYELIDEYRRESGGNAFFLASLADFLSLFGVNQDVVAEVREEEAARALPKARIREATIRGFEAEAAVGNWLAKQFPDATIEQPHDLRAVDYVVKDPTGVHLAVDVMYSRSQDPIGVSKRIRDRSERAYYAMGAADYSEFLLCVIVPTRVAAEWYAERLRPVVHSGPAISISFGVVDGSLYSEVARIQALGGFGSDNRES